MKTDKIPLFQIYPELFLEDKEALSEIVHRTTNPELETLTLPNKELIVANSTVSEVDSDLVQLVLQNEVIDVTYGDIFLGGRKDVVFARVIYINNGKELEELINKKYMVPGRIGYSALDELATFNDPLKETVYVDDGHIYLSASIKNKNSALWSGSKFRYIPRDSDSESQEYYKRFLDRLTQLYRDDPNCKISLYWVLWSPIDVVVNTVLFLNELRTEISERLKN